MQQKPNIQAVHINHNGFELSSLEVGLLVVAELHIPVFSEATIDALFLRIEEYVDSSGYFAAVGHEL